MFGGGSAKPIVPAAAPPVAPTPDAAEVAKAAAEERARLRARKGRQSTILTAGSLSDTGGSSLSATGNPTTSVLGGGTRGAAAILLALLLGASPAWAATLTLTWTDNAANEQGFRIERCQAPAGGTCTTFVQIATVSAAAGTGGTKTWISGNLAVNATYCYRVRAYMDTLVSDYSNVACGTTGAPSAPTGLQAK